jgi:hypothetical protein
MAKVPVVFVSECVLFNDFPNVFPCLEGDYCRINHILNDFTSSLPVFKSFSHGKVGLAIFLPTNTNLLLWF